MTSGFGVKEGGIGRIFPCLNNAKSVLEMALRMGLNETILFEPDVFRTFDFSHYFPAIWQPPKCC